MPHPISQSEQLSYEEFLSSYDGTHAEWVDGTVVEMTPVSPRNQKIANFLVSLFQHFCETNDAGEVLSAPVQMKVGSSGREPDVMVLRSEHLDRIRATRVQGAADLVVEIISPDSRKRDRIDKFAEYAQAGVREYWLLDQPREHAEFYGLDEHGEYQLLPVEDGRFESRVLSGFWIRVEWLWQDPLPPLMWVLREWGLL
jgi:Uma2 family endonuclease